jgi:hypothetical protein
MGPNIQFSCKNSTNKNLSNINQESARSAVVGREPVNLLVAGSKLTATANFLPKKQKKSR